MRAVQEKSYLVPKRRRQTEERRRDPRQSNGQSMGPNNMGPNGHSNKRGPGGPYPNEDQYRRGGEDYREGRYPPQPYHNGGHGGDMYNGGGYQQHPQRPHHVQQQHPQHYQPQHQQQHPHANRHPSNEYSPHHQNTPHQQNYPSQQQDGGAVRNPRGGKKQRSSGNEREMSKNTLKITNIDSKYVNMSSLSMHFAYFGNVVNVQMCPKDREAYVQFEVEDDATKAFKSPLSVCQNRFIVVKRARSDAEAPAGAAPKGTGEAILSENAAKAAEKGKEVLKARLELRDQQKALLAQRESLLSKQLEHHQKMLNILDKNDTTTDTEKKIVNEKIQALTQDLATVQVALGKEPIVTPKAVQIAALKGQLQTLQTQAAARTSVYPRNNRSRNGRSLDLRTTVLRVERIPETAQDQAVLSQHFSTFGTVEELVLENDSATVRFAQRYQAEKAKTNGAFYGEDNLALSWIENSPAQA